MGYQRRVHGDFGPVFTFDSSERTASQTPQITMAELSLKKKEIDAINFAFDVYDFKGDGKVDAFYAGDLIRACNLNHTLKTIKEIGGGCAKGEKFLNISPRRNSSQLNIPRPRSLDRSLSRSTLVSWPWQGAQKSWWNFFLSAILATRPSHGIPHS